ncbi:DnaA N-terminal domain-containing protein [Rickettsia hoogstraalii]|uniref:DnaA N-terminal domain-containing protein n=1 Tax=Rickettsia hoogstraalii TaxID=467174 RepID=UPI00059066EA|nr:DnaA N-terminal domain-containing protein [Rickettsia hoogstraalii]
MKREILTNEVCSVYGKNKCYLDSFKTGLKISEEEGATEEAQSESTSEPKLGKPRCIPLSSLTKDSVWRQVRQELVLQQYGNDIDTAWFSKAEVKECKETGTLILTMPNKFMSYWLQESLWLCYI